MEPKQPVKDFNDYSRIRELANDTVKVEVIPIDRIEVEPEIIPEAGCKDGICEL